LDRGVAPRRQMRPGPGRRRRAGPVPAAPGPVSRIRIPPTKPEGSVMEIVFNLLIVLLIAGLTYALTSEGLWGSALMCFNVLFAGMIAFIFYEPLAVLLDKTGINWGFSDTLCLLVLFGVSVVALRLITESLAPAMVRFPTPIYHAGRLIFG